MYTAPLSREFCNLPLIQQVKHTLTQQWQQAVLQHVRFCPERLVQFVFHWHFDMWTGGTSISGQSALSSNHSCIAQMYISKIVQSHGPHYSWRTFSSEDSGPHQLPSSHCSLFTIRYDGNSCFELRRAAVHKEREQLVIDIVAKKKFWENVLWLLKKTMFPVYYACKYLFVRDLFVS